MRSVLSVPPLLQETRSDFSDTLSVSILMIAALGIRARAIAQPLPQLGGGQHFDHGSRKCIGCPIRHKQTVLIVSEDLQDSIHRRSYDRNATCKRFDHCSTERFRARWNDDHVAGVVECRHVRYGAQRMKTIAHSPPIGLIL